VIGPTGGESNPVATAAGRQGLLQGLLFGVARRSWCEPLIRDRLDKCSFHFGRWKCVTQNSRCRYWAHNSLTFRFSKGVRRAKRFPVQQDLDAQQTGNGRLTSVSPIKKPSRNALHKPALLEQRPNSDNRWPREQFGAAS